MVLIECKSVICSLWNLRRTDGVTNLGEKAILFCDVCKTGHTSEDLAIALLCKVLGRQKVVDDGKMPTYKESLWEKNGFVSKAFIHAEMLLFKESIPPAVGRKRTTPFKINSNGNDKTYEQSMESSKNRWCNKFR